MSRGGWDFGGAFAQGYDIGDRMAERRRTNRRDAEEQNRYAGAQAQAAQDRDRASAHRAEDQSYREREEMRKGLESDASIEEKMAHAWALRNPQPRAEPRGLGEQAVGAKLKELGMGIEDINAKEEGMKKWYLPASMEEKLPAEEVQMRERLKSRRIGLLGMSGGDQVPDRMSAPAPKNNAKEIYIQARRAGKSEEEARRLAGGK